MEAFSFFWVSIYWYGIFYFLAFSFWYLFLLFVKRKWLLVKYSLKLSSLLDKSSEDIILFIVLGVLVWWRLWDVFIYNFSYYYHYPLHVFYIWEWGMSFIGWIIWVVLSLFFFLYKKKFSFKDFLILTDILIIPTSFWIMLWRIGNYLNQELYGRLVYDIFPSISNRAVDFFSSISLFHVYGKIDNNLRINTNFLSSFFEWFVILVVSSSMFFYFIKRKYWKPWFISAFFLMFYSFVRFVLEYIRMDSQSEYISLFTKSQWFFLLFFLVWICFMILSYRKNYIK